MLIKKKWSHQVVFWQNLDKTFASTNSSKTISFHNGSDNDDFLQYFTQIVLDWINYDTSSARKKNPKTQVPTIFDIIYDSEYFLKA